MGEREVRYRKNRYDRRMAAGLCVACGKVPPEDGTVRCADCKKIGRRSVSKARVTKKQTGICRESGCHKSATGTFCDEHRLANRRMHITGGRRLKIECFEAYGGAKCACCGEPELSVLCLDHIYNDGAAHRRELKRVSGSHVFYRHLKSLGFPDRDRYQVLCANCNLYKLVKGSPCYHTKPILTLA